MIPTLFTMGFIALLLGGIALENGWAYLLAAVCAVCATVLGVMA